MNTFYKIIYMRRVEFYFALLFRYCVLHAVLIQTIIPTIKLNRINIINGGVFN